MLGPTTGDSVTKAEWSGNKITANGEPAISSTFSSRLKFPAHDYAFIIFTLLEKVLFDFFLNQCLILTSCLLEAIGQCLYLTICT